MKHPRPPYRTYGQWPAGASYVGLPEDHDEDFPEVEDDDDEETDQ